MAAFSLAPMSLLAPTSALTIVINALAARIILGEVMAPDSDRLGTAAIISIMLHCHYDVTMIIAYDRHVVMIITILIAIMIIVMMIIVAVSAAAAATAAASLSWVVIMAIMNYCR